MSTSSTLNLPWGVIMVLTQLPLVDGPDPLDFGRGLRVLVSPRCLMIAAIGDDEGQVTIEIGAKTPTGLNEAARGTLEVPEGWVRAQTVEGDELVSLEVPPGWAPFTIWCDDHEDAQHVYIQIGAGGKR